MLCQVVVALAVAVGVTLAHPGSYDDYKSEPLPYYFDYNVYDDYKGANFGQHEKSDGKAVYGSYTVDLPDGRKQSVDYMSHPYTGYVAKVTYEGKAYHPKYTGNPATYFKGSHHGSGYGSGHGYGHGYH